MFCKNCGIELPEEQVRFCPSCGTEMPAEAAPASEPAPAGETASLGATSVDEPIVAAEPTSAVEADPAAFGDKKPKKKKKGLIVGLSAALGVVAALVAVVLLFGEQLLGFYYRTFASPEEYFSYVEAKHFEKQLKAFASSYKGMEEYEDSYTLTGKLGVSVSDELLALLYGGGGDANEESRALAEWLESLNIEFVTKKDGELSSLEYSLTREEKAVLGFLAIMDGAEGDMYLSLPGLDDRFQKQEGAKAPDEERLKELLPDEELVERVMKRYRTVIFDALPDFTLEKGAYPAENGDVEAYLISVTVSSDDLDAVLEALLNEAEDDAELEEIYDSLLDVLEEIGIEEKLFPDYDELFEQTEEEEASRKDEEDVEFTLTDYVNGKNELIGRSFRFNDHKEPLELRWLRDGEQIDFFFGDEKNSLVAFGTKSEGESRVEGELRAPDADYELCFLWTEERGDKKSSASLEASLSPSKGEAVYDCFKLTLLRTTEETHGEFELALFGDDEKLLGFAVENTIEKGAEVTLPAEDKLLKEEMNLLEDFDQEDLAELMEKLQLPDSVLRGTPFDPSVKIVATEVTREREGYELTYYRDYLAVYPEGNSLAVMDVAAAVADELGGYYSAYYNQYTAFAGIEEEGGYYWYAYVDGVRIQSWNQTIDEDSVVEFRYELP